MVARARAGEHEIAGQMDESRVMPTHEFGQDDGAGDVDEVSHRGIELARFESAIAVAVEHAAKAEPIEQAAHADGVLGVERDDAGADELPRLVRPDADDL